jgi:hypothetical protein
MAKRNPTKRNPLGLAADTPKNARKRSAAKSFEQNDPCRFEQQTPRSTWPNTQGVVAPMVTITQAGDAGGQIDSHPQGPMPNPHPHTRFLNDAARRQSGMRCAG